MTLLTAHQRADGMWVVPRDEFARDRFSYKPGQHVVFAGPTQRAGKTTLAFKLLEYTASPDLPALVAVCKPKDRVSTNEGKRLGYRRVEEYPVPKRLTELWGESPSEYLVWPKFGDIETDAARAAKVTGDLIDYVYSNGARTKEGKGQAILVLDDTVVKSKILRLDKKMIMIITMSGAMGVGGWFFVQKPTDAGDTALWSYPNAEHVFISKDPERRNRVRYNEIGGFDSDEVFRAMNTLTSYQFLYLERSHNYMCIVDKD